MPSRNALALRTPGQTCGHEPNCGCDAAGCCLNCPLPYCQYDFGRRHEVVAERRKEVQRLTEEGLRPYQIAAQMQLSYKTVQTDLEKLRGK